MAKYAINNTFSGAQNLGALVANMKTIVEVQALSTSLSRGKLYDYTISADGAYASTDTNVIFQIVRISTSIGTTTTCTPNPLDPADVASRQQANMNNTGEATIGVELDHFVFNQRATYRWSAVPGSELVWAATSFAGLALRAAGQTGGYASTVSMKALYEDQ